MSSIIQLHKMLTVVFIVTFMKYVESADESKSHNRQYTCCARHEKIIKIGHGISGEVIEYDAGQCRKLCPKDVFYDPGDRSKPAVQKCTQNRHCRPRLAKIDRISTIEGVREIENIEMCECSAQQYCKRKKFNLLFYSGTHYQTNIDVGLCTGYCSHDLGCKPVRNRTITIKGPNGNEIHQMIEKCGCTHSCYRVDYVETILDYSRVEIKYGIDTSEVRPFVRQINVGKCAGNCNNSQTETCLIRDTRSPYKCFTSYFVQNHCAPVKFKVQEYRTRRGALREIIQISECDCV